MRSSLQKGRKKIEGGEGEHCRQLCDRKMQEIGKQV